MSPSTAEDLFFVPASYVERLDYEAMFATRQPVEVEIGCGDGGFLAQYAARHPERNFLGVERLKGRLGKLARRGPREGLTNVRLLRIEAAYFVEYLLPPASVATVHIYFPDPWPKKRHHKNRLIQSPFVTLLARALAPGGTVYLRTDNLEYFTQMLEVFGGASQFSAVETPAELREVITDFEREFNAQGVPTNYAAYRLR
jgi:tRNA (guanine-N7-)-methyltransferase